MNIDILKMTNQETHLTSEKDVKVSLPTNGNVYEDLNQMTLVENPPVYDTLRVSHST